MKYLIAASTFLLCCSFISFRFEERDNYKWTLRTYPFESDTTTYILREYLQLGRKDATNNSNAGEYIIKENLFIKAKRKRSIECYVRKQDTMLTENQYFDDGIYEQRKSNRPFSFTTIFLNDSLRLNVSYYNSGLVKECRLNHSRSSKPIEVITWDAQNQAASTGRELYTPIYDTVYDISNGWETMRVKVTDSFQKQGLWKKYNRAGKVIDSMFYK